jgi:hypothetical protein
MKNTDVRVESRMSSIWALPVRAFAGVNRLVLIVDAVGLVETVRRAPRDGRGVAEVLEHGAGARTDDLAQVLGERLRAGQVERAEPALGQLGDEVEGDDRLPGPGTALDEEDDLLLVMAAPRIRPVALKATSCSQEREDGLVLDEPGDVVQQPLVRFEHGRGDLLEDRAIVRADDVLLEEAGQLADGRAREERVQGEERLEVGVVQRGRRVVLGVVQVRARLQFDRAIRERRVGVHEVTLVLRDLLRGVQDVLLVPAAVLDGDAVGDVRPPDLRPLLELDDHRGVATIGFEPVIITSRRLESAAASLDDDPLVAHVRQLQHVRHRPQRVLPGRDLTR